MTELTRRQVLGSAGVAALASVAAATSAPNDPRGAHAVPSGRVDGVRTGSN